MVSAQEILQPKGPPAPETIARPQMDIGAVVQDHEGKVFKLHGHAWVETTTILVRADEMTYDEDTGDMTAQGHVYYHNFSSREEIWCDRLEYNYDDEKGKFYDVEGETHPRVVSRPGVLTGNSPFHFEGKWAERVGENHYILYQGWVTNCKLPTPWWRLRGPKFDIVLEDRAIAHNSWFLVRNIPIFFTPFFYHSLKKEPRKSGFLLPNLVPHSQRGPMVGLGYFWAINRSFDLTYRFQDYTTNALAHHVDLRGAPRAGSDFDFIAYGVQDYGYPGYTPASGYSIYGIGKSDLGNGWTAHGTLNYISSFNFRQNWTQSFNELIGSEIHSDGFINKNWSTFTFDTVFSRLENFQSVELSVTNPATGESSLTTNAVLIRKLPEAQFSSRDHPLWGDLPVWFSFDSAAGMLYRSEPLFTNTATPVFVNRFETTQFMNRTNLAPHLTTAIHAGAIDLVPSVGFDETFYGESQGITPTQTPLNVYGLAPTEGLYRATGTDIVRSERDFSLDIILPSLARVYNRKTKLGDKLKHVIEPRLTYHYATGVGSDFNRFVRFDSTDLLSNTNELALSLTNRLYAKRGDTVTEVFSWELIQKRYFDPTFGGALISGQRNVFAATDDLTAYAFLVGPRNSSPIASNMRAALVGGLGIQWQADYDPRLHGVVDSSFSLDYRWKKYFISAGNNEVHNNPLLTPSANQYRGRVGFGDPNHRGWNAGVDLIYDYRQGVLQYTTTQVTYNTDCCGFSVQYHRFSVPTQPDRSELRFSFAVANVGSFGTLRKQDRLF